jgi:hypothetical protein
MAEKGKERPFVDFSIGRKHTHCCHSGYYDSSENHGKAVINDTPDNAQYFQATSDILSIALLLNTNLVRLKNG